MKIDIREQYEREFLAIIFNRSQAIEMLQIKPKYLKYEKNQIMLEYAVENYKKNKTIVPTEILDLHNDFDIDYFAAIYTGTLWHEFEWREQFEVLQNNIIKYYKEDLIENLYQQLLLKKIKYDDYIKKIKELDSIQLTKSTLTLTRKEILDTMNENQNKIKLTKFEKMNNTLKLVQGDFLVIGGLTGSGKSGLMLNLMADLMKNYQCIYFNMEMSKSTVYKRLVAILSGLRIMDVDKPQTAHQDALVNSALDFIELSKIIVEHKASSLKDIKSTIIKMKDKTKHTIVFIDHFGLIKKDNIKSLYEQTTEIAKELRQLCLDNDCTIIASSQLNRTAYQADVLTLNMLKDTGELENSASKVVLIYKALDESSENLRQQMIFDIAKNRDGFTGLINVIYDKEKQIFEEEKEKYR